jgi:peptidyl-tRNA hydrolase
MVRSLWPARIRAVESDPLRMYLVIRRGAFEDLASAGELAGAAAVRCVREFAGDDSLEAWRPRPGKVVLRARGGQWDEVLASEPHALAGDPDGEAVIALPPRRRSERGPLLERMQAMTSALTPPPPEPERRPGAVTYLVNPEVEMSSGKTLAQIAHAAVMAADGGLEEWVAAGCPGQVVRPPRARFEELCTEPGLVARVEDAGLTEVPPGTVTVLALPPEE